MQPYSGEGGIVGTFRSDPPVIPVHPNRVCTAFTAVQLAVLESLACGLHWTMLRERALQYGRDISNEADIDAVLACIDLDKLGRVGR